MSSIHWGRPKRSSSHLIDLLDHRLQNLSWISQLNLLTISQKLNQLPYRGISFPCIPYSFGYNLQFITITIENRGMVLIWIFISGFTTTDRSTYYNTGGNDTIPFFLLLVKKIPRYWKSWIWKSLAGSIPFFFWERRNPDLEVGDIVSEFLQIVSREQSLQIIGMLGPNLGCVFKCPWKPHAGVEIRHALDKIWHPTSTELSLCLHRDGITVIQIVLHPSETPTTKDVDWAL